MVTNGYLTAMSASTAENPSTRNPYTRGIAEFVAGLTYERIPPEVRERLKLLALDAMGCALYGVKLPWSQILIGCLARLDCSDGCAAWGTARRFSPPHAALINGTLVQSFELDDVHRYGVLHVGAVTLPPLLAVCELHRELTGKDFLTAAVAGYEIGPRVGLCMGPEHIGQGWHSGATVGVFSAAASAAAGLRLTAEATVHALGIAGTQAAGLMAAQYGAMVKRMHAGRSAQSGLYAALLAEAGFTGIPNVFESEYGGFCTTFSRSRDRFDLTQLTAGLGERFETMRIALKFYSCVGSNHTTLDALRALRARHPFRAEEIDRITVHGSRVTVDHVGWPYQPQSLTAAQLNLPYCVATLLLEGEAFVDQFREELVADPLRIALSRKVEVIEDPSITARGAEARHAVRVQVRLRDGTCLEQRMETARGDDQNFASAEEVIRKFRLLAGPILGAPATEKLCDVLLHAEKLESAAAIPRLLSRPSP